MPNGNISHEEITSGQLNSLIDEVNRLKRALNEMQHTVSHIVAMMDTMSRTHEKLALVNAEIVKTLKDRKVLAGG